MVARPLGELEEREEHGAFFLSGSVEIATKSQRGCAWTNQRGDPDPHTPKEEE